MATKTDPGREQSELLGIAQEVTVQGLLKGEYSDLVLSVFCCPSGGGNLNVFVQLAKKDQSDDSGRGLVLQHLRHKLGHEHVYGLDTSEKMVAAAKQRGCSNVHLVSGDDLNIGVGKFETIILSTGVLDSMEHSEMASFIATLTQMLSESGRLWIYVFGQFGPNWKVAGALGAICPLGIANNVLFDLY